MPLRSDSRRSRVARRGRAVLVRLSIFPLPAARRRPDRREIERDSPLIITASVTTVNIRASLQPAYPDCQRIEQSRSRRSGRGRTKGGIAYIEMAVRDIRSVGSRRKSRERIYLTPRDSAPLCGARGSAEREEFTCQPELKDGGIARARARERERETRSARFPQLRRPADRPVPISRCRREDTPSRPPSKSIRPPPPSLPLAPLQTAERYSEFGGKVRSLG